MDGNAHCCYGCLVFAPFFHGEASEDDKAAAVQDVVTVLLKLWLKFRYAEGVLHESEI